jgi:hypothetical protein
MTELFRVQMRRYFRRISFGQNNGHRQRYGNTDTLHPSVLFHDDILREISRHLISAAMLDVQLPCF